MKNLKAEMVRMGITVVDLQKTIGCTEKTVRNKINQETSFSFPEAVLIRNTYFPGYRLEYLFAEDGDENAS